MGRVRGPLEACGDRRRTAWFAEADVVAHVRDADFRQARCRHRGPADDRGGNTRAGNDDDPRIIEETRRYIRDFDRAVEETATARELYDAMRAFYPDRVNPGALWSSARAVKP